MGGLSHAKCTCPSQAWPLASHWRACVCGISMAWTMHQMPPYGPYSHITSIISGQWACDQGTSGVGQPCTCALKPTFARAGAAMRALQPVPASHCRLFCRLMLLLGIAGVCIISDQQRLMVGLGFFTLPICLNRPYFK